MSETVEFGYAWTTDESVLSRSGARSQCAGKSPTSSICFRRFTRSAAQEEMSLQQYLLACREDKSMYATAPERMVDAIGEPTLGRHQQGRAARPHFREPDDQDLSRLRRFLRHGGHDRADRRLFPLCRPGARGAQADPLSARPRRRRQIVAGRAAEEADGAAADLHAEGRRPDQPGLRIAARPVPSRPHGRPAGGQIRHCAAPAERPDLALGGQAARRIRRRHLEIQRRQADAVAAAPDRHRQDRAGRRKQPGRLGAGRQGRHPPARKLQPVRSGRLFLQRRAEPHDARACSNSSRCSRRRSRSCIRC